MENKKQNWFRKFLSARGVGQVVTVFFGLICLIVAADNFYTLTHGGKDHKTQRRLTSMGIGALIVLMAILFVLFKTILGR